MPDGRFPQTSWADIINAREPSRRGGRLLGRTEEGVRKAAFDLREVYKKLRAEVARLVGAPDGTQERKALVREEARYLLQALED